LRATPTEQQNCADEKLPVFIVLQNIVPLSDELYEHYLARLAVSLEVAAIDGSQSPQGYPGRGQDNVHMLFQTVINEKDTPRILAGDATKRLAIWKLEVPLGHPRARLSNPRVIITCSATLRPAELQKPLFEDEYITSRQPMGINLLESFIEDTSVPGTVVPPRLSAHRVSRVIPATPAPQEMLRPLGYAAKRSFDIYPAINIRLRYSRIPAGGKQIVIASLDLEVTPFSDCRVTIESVDITVLGGHAELLADTPTAVLPVTCRPRDDMTFLYKIRQDPTVEASSAIPGIAATTVTTTPSQIHSISVNLMATALVSAVCRPRIETHWTTTVDFAPPTVHQFGATAPSGISRPHRPASLGSIIHGATVQASSGIRPSLTPGSALSPKVVFTPPTDSRNFGAPHMPQEPPMPTPDPANHGLTVTFTGPSRVYVGEVFAWSVFVVNRSNRLRKLALVLPPPRRKKAEVTGKPSLPSPLAGDPPEPVVDDTLVAGSHRAGFLEPAELLALSNDIRIG
jgi:hypothetical protein